ncbi:oxidoreductase-like protein [Mycena galopus ATCC 62051]|nr:oxidoreductase-like protein [Mycena galopus ATCC 62051]
MFALPYTRRHASLSLSVLPLRRYSALDAGAVERLKKANRGGQNLSARWRRLEQSLRGKEALQRDILARDPGVGADFRDTSPVAKTKGVNRYFRGLKVPQEPKPPESDECCMSGCAICVYDLYEESLAAYKESLAALRSTLTSDGIPEESWPKSIRAGVVAREKSVTLSAFEELEKSLKAKKDSGTP